MQQASAPPAVGLSNFAAEGHPERGTQKRGDVLLFSPTDGGHEYDPRCEAGSQVIFLDEETTQGGETPARVQFPCGLNIMVRYEDLWTLAAPLERQQGSWESARVGPGLTLENDNRLIKASAAPYEHAVALGNAIVTLGGDRVVYRLVLGDRSERSFVGFAKEGTPIKITAATMSCPGVFAIDTFDGALYSKARSQVGEPFLKRGLPAGTILTFYADPATGVISLSVDGETEQAVWKGIQDELPLRPFIELAAQGGSARVVA
eukprot:Hpha_TRINITY_DN26155_c0_g1::TRINITY_DN26155_c0_g1_i1::g.155488::m.155488